MPWVRKTKFLLFALFLGYPLLVLSFLSPRRRNKWVFGSDNGFGCNAKYLFINVIKERPDILPVWLSRDAAEVGALRNLGYRHVYCRNSVVGFFHLLTAGVYVTTHDLHRSLSIWTIGRAKWVNLWHGVGIKALRFKSKASYLHMVHHNRLLRCITYPLLIHLNYKPDVFLVTSPLMAKHFMGCFGLRETSLYEGMYPRCEPLFWDKPRLDSFVAGHEPDVTKRLIASLAGYAKVYVYVPTWRKQRGTFCANSGLDLVALNAVLAQCNCLMLVKLHPYVIRQHGMCAGQYSHLRLLSADLDLYDLLPYTNVLVTDYSSIYYDYILMRDKAVLLYPFDHDDYIKNSRDLAMDYERYMPGSRVHDFNQLCKAIEAGTETPTSCPQVQEIRKLFWSNAHSTTDLISKIDVVSKE